MGKQELCPHFYLKARGSVSRKPRKPLGPRKMNLSFYKAVV